MGRSFKVVILGGGTAGGYAASEFVKHGLCPGDLCIISEESVAPYERPALSKGYLLGKDPARLPAFHTCVGVGEESHSAKWFQEKGIELVLGTRVVEANVSMKTLVTAAGETISYSTLIVATGARVLKLDEFGVTGADAKNVCYLRNLEDATKLVDMMAECRQNGGKAVVIGGGYIGMECAAALHGNRIPVTMVFPEDYCMPRLFTPEIAMFYEDYYMKKGIQFKKGNVLSSFEFDDSGKVSAVILKDGSRVEATLVVCGIGIRPNVDLFLSQLTIENAGIKVNGKMQSVSNSSVYAVGDVATFPVPMYSDIRRLEHVDHARKSAAHAVQAILLNNKLADYDYLPYFYSRVFTLSWQFFGDNVGECILFGECQNSKFGAYWVHKGRILGAFLEGGSKVEYMALSKTARERPFVKDVGVLKKQGLEFALSAAEPSMSVPTSMSLMSSIESESEMLLSHPYKWVLQAGSGVALGLAVVGVIYWFGSRRSRKLNL